MEYMRVRILILFGLLQFQLKAQNLIVQATSSNVLYVGLDNELLIRYKGVKDKDLLVRTDKNGSIIHVKEATYIVNVHPVAKTCKIYIGMEKKKGNKWLDSIEIEVRSVPKGYGMFGELRGGNYTIDELVKQDSILYKMDVYIKGFKYKVTKYRITIIPFRGMMQEYEHRGPVINQEAKQAIAECNPKDVIYISGIRINGPGCIDKPVDAILITVDSKNWESNYSERIVGYYRDSGKLKTYKFPVRKGQNNNHYGLFKDSIWSTWRYNYSKKDYIINTIDSFTKGRRKLSIKFNDTSGIKENELRNITDSTYLYTTYYPNGNIHHKGLVCRNTLTRGFNKFYFYEDKSYPTKKEVWDLCILATPEYLYPIGPWTVYDSMQRIQLEVNYDFIRTDYPCKDNSSHHGPYYFPQCFYIVPQGPCTIYEKGKVKETIMFKDGKIESRR